MQLYFIHTRSANTRKGTLELYQVFKGGATKVIWKSETLSGQIGYEKTQWTRGKSPIPPFEKGRLHLKPKQPDVFETGYSGIGEFWPISSGKDPRIITTGKKDQIRYDIGWHIDNAMPGSAGCIVAPKTDTHIAKFKQLSELLKKVAKDGVEWIEFTSAIVP